MQGFNDEKGVVAVFYAVVSRNLSGRRRWYFTCFVRLVRTVPALRYRIVGGRTLIGLQLGKRRGRSFTIPGQCRNVYSSSTLRCKSRLLPL